jgi:hypothetical protein
MMKIQSMIYDNTSSLEMCAIAPLGDMGPISLALVDRVRYAAPP